MLDRDVRTYMGSSCARGNGLGKERKSRWDDAGPGSVQLHGARGGHAERGSAFSAADTRLSLLRSRAHEEEATAPGIQLLGTGTESESSVGWRRLN